MEIEKVLTSDVVDLSSLKSFFASDKDSLIQLITVYLSDTTPRTIVLEYSITNVNYEDVRSICHFLKSSLGLMGVKCLHEIANLEKLAQAREPESAIIEQLKLVIPILKNSTEEYKKILEKLKAL
jgi:HPt (histidine-containing phosphotransfer) domain-containing protein